MTLEGHDPGADDTPAPPARTRWSEDAADDDDVLLPPYVPGARPDPPSPRADTRGVPAPPEDRESPDEGSGADGTDPWAGEEVALPEPEPAAATVEPESEPTAAPGADEDSADYPWEPEGSTEDLPGGPELMELDPYHGALEAPDASFGDDPALYDAYDLGGDTEEPTPLPGLGGAYEEPDAAALPPLEPAFGVADLHSAAERLERLGDVLRAEGRAGIERELASRDRLTSLLAGVVAGYLAGLED